MRSWTLEEQKEHRKEWVAALRSGEFEQGKFCLNGNNRYCCLGVACELMSRKGLLKRTIEQFEEITYVLYDGEDNIPPAFMLDYYGLKDNSGSCKNEYEEKTSLMSLNDVLNYNFDKIANIIESEPAGLFAV